MDNFLFEQSRTKYDPEASFHKRKERKKKPKVFENKDPKVNNSVCKENCQWPRNSDWRIKHECYLEPVLFVKGHPSDDASQSNKYTPLDKCEFTKERPYTFMSFIFKNRSNLIGNIHIDMFMHTPIYKSLCIYILYICIYVYICIYISYINHRVLLTSSINCLLESS